MAANSQFKTPSCHEVGTKTAGPTFTDLHNGPEDRHIKRNVLHRSRLIDFHTHLPIGLNPTSTREEGVLGDLNMNPTIAVNPPMMR